MGCPGTIPWKMEWNPVKRMILALLAAALLFTGCSAPGKQGKDLYRVGDEVDTYWFEFAVDKAETAGSHGVYVPQDGCRLVLCRLTVKNTFPEAVPMGWADFVLEWEPLEEGTVSASGLTDAAGAFALPCYVPEQFPDEYTLEKGEERTGLLIFEVPLQVKRARLVFQELYAEGESESDYTEGRTWQVALDLE